MFVVSQSLYTLALMFLLGLAVVKKSAVGSAGVIEPLGWNGYIVVFPPNINNSYIINKL